MRPPNGISLTIRQHFLEESRLCVAGGACPFGVFGLQAAALPLRFHLLAGFIDFPGYDRPGRSRLRTLRIPCATRLTVSASAAACARIISSRLPASMASALARLVHLRQVAFVRLAGQAVAPAREQARHGDEVETGVEFLADAPLAPVVEPVHLDDVLRDLVQLLETINRIPMKPLQGQLPPSDRIPDPRQDRGGGGATTGRMSGQDIPKNLPEQHRQRLEPGSAQMILSRLQQQDQDSDSFSRGECPPAPTPGGHVSHAPEGGRSCPAAGSGPG